MEREIIRHSEGYWSLVDEQGSVICKFKLDNKVKIVYTKPVDALQSFDKYIWGEPQKVKVEEVKGCAEEVSFLSIGCFINVTTPKRYFYPINIQSIIKMEVIE